MQSKFFQIRHDDVFERLDKVLTKRFLNKTRSYFQKLIAAKRVLVNGKVIKAGARLQYNDRVEVHFPATEILRVEAKPIPLNIVYEDADILVINKPAGIVVHPGARGAHLEDSLVNAILFHCREDLTGIGGALRPGIVHRLDKDTSGLLVVAKNEKAQLDLSAQFKAHAVKKTYYALVVGHLKPKEGMIEAPIARARHDRKKMAVSAHNKAKEAFTAYKVIEYPDGCSFVEVSLLTGRTHQIRVHFASIGFPIVGDQTYGNGKINKVFYEKYGLKRQFLHACRLELSLPGMQKKAVFKAPLPADLEKVMGKNCKNSYSDGK